MTQQLLPDLPGFFHFTTCASLRHMYAPPLSRKHQATEKGTSPSHNRPFPYFHLVGLAENRGDDWRQPNLHGKSLVKLQIAPIHVMFHLMLDPYYNRH